MYQSQSSDWGLGADWRELCGDGSLSVRGPGHKRAHPRVQLVGAHGASNDRLNHTASGEPHLLDSESDRSPPEFFNARERGLQLTDDRLP